eukprot:gene797-9047_t
MIGQFQPLNDEEYSTAFQTMLKYHKDWKVLDNLLAERMAKGILKSTSKKNDVKILSVGIGTGGIDSLIYEIISKRIKLSLYQGIEPNEEHFQELKKIDNFKKESCFNFEKKTFEEFNSDVKYDFILFCHSFYYLDHQESLKKSLKMLNTDGRILVAIDNGEMWSVITKFGFKETVYVFPNLIEDLKNLNLQFESMKFEWEINLKSCFQNESNDKHNLLNWMTFVNFSKLNENLKNEVLNFLKEITKDNILYGSEHLLLIK